MGAERPGNCVAPPGSPLRTHCRWHARSERAIGTPRLRELRRRRINSAPEAREVGGAERSCLADCGTLDPYVQNVSQPLQ